MASGNHSWHCTSRPMTMCINKEKLCILYTVFTRRGKGGTTTPLRSNVKLLGEMNHNKKKKIVIKKCGE